MADNTYHPPPKMQATFSPNDLDDYYMPAASPDLISPAPQRITPEVPGQIQHSLSVMELDDTSVGKRNTMQNQVSQAQQQQQLQPYPPQHPQPYNQPPSHYDQQQTPQHDQLQYQTQDLQQLQPSQQKEHWRQQPQQHYAPASEVTSYAQPAWSNNYESNMSHSNTAKSSAFPKVPHRTPNIPPPDEEREATLESARIIVLESPDPEMQLEWAQDALACVDRSIEYDRRLAQFQPPRPSTPPVERQMRIDAVNIVQFLAEQQHPRADFIKGLWLEFGKFGYSQDKPESFRCYKRAAANGYPRAEYRMGLQFESTGEHVKALQHYKTGEALGDSASCYRMGMMALRGQLGQAQDYGIAIRLIRQAADTADENAPQGAYVYGMLLARELNEVKVPEVFLPIDLVAAKSYIEKAAFFGFSKAQLKMGSAYELCLLNCEFDPTLSLHYNALAAGQGEPEAEMSISKWYLCGYEGLFAKNEEMAYTYAQRAASSGLATAEFAMGYFNEIGMHVQVNLQNALYWYDKAERSGSTDARGRIDQINKAQTLTKNDHEKVAVQRIRSQHGSMRGNKVDRFGNPSRPMANIKESEHSQSVPPAIPPHPSAPPVTGRVTPYPVDDRPVSTAPYPVNDYQRFGSSPPATTGPAGAYLSPQQRPSSSMSDGRYVRADAVSSQPGSYPHQRPMLMPPLRPYTSTGDLSSPPQQRLPPQRTPLPARVPSTPPVSNQSSEQSIRQSSSQASKLDIGFSAPVDARADHRNKAYGGPTSSSVQGVNQRRTAAGPSAPKPPDGAGRSTKAYNPKYHSGLKPANAVMSGGLSSTGAASSTPQNPTSSGQKPTAPSQSQSGVGKPTTSTPGTAASTAQRPPGKGPQTFEEMGVPAGKSDHDCVLM